ncbi:hypothetical protein [Spiroplasma endosymbiont of Danaus chrysippus]|uniref:hypothetical protein n=1 Tax=Spiroplasma endosymbiont of Danaus chrysippus TaxID=2691041 RepID=UPI00157A8E31|nr:hypothetical protein [Spiroplasma endosymbiont of Danaus chrysippus]
MITKKEQDFINSQILKNQKNIEEIEKQIQSLEKERNYFKNEISINEITIKNFKTNIFFWSEQSKKIETKIINYQKQILKLKKQKINKIKNFFIKFFSLGKININQNINNLTQQEEKNCELLKETNLNNQKKIEILNLSYNENKENQKNLITNINKIIENINKLLNHKNKLLQNNNNLLFNLLNQKQQKVIIKVDEQTIEKYELEIFKLNEKICDLENKLLSSSNDNDEGFHSKSTSTNSLPSSNSLSLNKQQKPQIPKVINNLKEKIKPWEETLREYPTEKSIQKNKLNLWKI